MLHSVSLLTVTMIALNVPVSVAADPIFDMPWAPVAAETADLAHRAEDALLQYARSCATSGATGSDSLKDNAVIEYATSKTGVFIAADAAYVHTCWEGATQMNRAIDSHVRLYPMSYPNSVFVQFQTEGEAGVIQDHLSVIEIDGTRISRIRDMTTKKSAADL